MLLLYGNYGAGLGGVADVTHVVGVGDCDRGGGGGVTVLLLAVVGFGVSALDNDYGDHDHDVCGDEKTNR